MSPISLRSAVTRSSWNVRLRSSGMAYWRAKRMMNTASWYVHTVFMSVSAFADEEAGLVLDGAPRVAGRGGMLGVPDSAEAPPREFEYHVAR